MMPPTLSIRLLGDFSLMSGAELVTSVNTPRLHSLLAYLVLHRDAPQLRQHLAFLFWPDTAEAQARTNLRQVNRQPLFPVVLESFHGRSRPQRFPVLLCRKHRKPGRCRSLIHLPQFRLSSKRRQLSPVPQVRNRGSKDEEPCRVPR